MKMETPKNQDAHSTSSTLKNFLNDETYLKALHMFENAQRKLIKFMNS